MKNKSPHPAVKLSISLEATPDSLFMFLTVAAVKWLNLSQRVIAEEPDSSKDLWALILEHLEIWEDMPPNIKELQEKALRTVERAQRKKK
jgi:hypothetical protein